MGLLWIKVLCAEVLLILIFRYNETESWTSFRVGLRCIYRCQWWQFREDWRWQRTGRFVSADCSSFSAKYSLDYHRKKNHLGDSSIKCDRCSEVCQDILSYMRHKKSHLLSNNDCSQCDIIISGKNNLNCHKLEIHEADKDLPLWMWSVHTLD